MRVTTAFKRLLRLPGASVADVSFGAEGVVVTVRLRRRRRVCAACGQTGRQLEIRRSGRVGGEVARMPPRIWLETGDCGRSGRPRKLRNSLPRSRSAGAA